jgi:hypothetical protein
MFSSGEQLSGCDRGRSFRLGRLLLLADAAGGTLALLRATTRLARPACRSNCDGSRCCPQAAQVFTDGPEPSAPARRALGALLAFVYSVL